MNDVARPNGPEPRGPGALSPPAPEAALGFRLSRVVRVMRADWAQRLVVLELTPPQAAVLRAIGARPGTSLRALARQLGTDAMKAKRCVDDLEARDLLCSAHRGDDRRPRGLALSHKGRDLARLLDSAVRRQEDHLFRDIEPGLRAGLEAGVSALERQLGLVDVQPHANSEMAQ